METRIFGRLSAWQNWIFSRPNAVGAKGALKVYGTGSTAEIRQGANLNDRLHRRESRTTSIWRTTRRLQRALEHWQPAFLNWWNDTGPADSSTLDVYLRTAISVGRRRLGQLRLREDAGLSLGNFSGAARRGPARFTFGDHKGAAGMAGGARRIPLHAAPHHRHAGRYGTGVGRAAAAPRA